jgi:hypothetical protein
MGGELTMYRRVLFIFFFIIFLIIALNIWIGHEVAKMQPVSEEKKEIPEAVVVEEPIVSQEPPLAADFPLEAHEEKPVVTIIKPALKEKPIPEAVSQQAEVISDMTAHAGSLHSGTSVLSEKTPKAGADALGPGVTEVSTKRPSETERKEMNTRGIVMW